MNTPHSFGLIDWTVLAAYAATLLGIGYYYSRQQSTAEEYFLGGRNVGPFLAGISLFTAITSIITYVGTPGEYIQYGPVLAVVASLVALPFTQIIIGRWLIPVIMSLPITSAYELLEGRLGRAVRQTGSLAYILTRFVWMALILFTSAKVLINVIGCDPRWSVPMMVVIGLVTTIYTLIGGIRTVMITETLQFFIMLLGATLTIVSITIKLGGFSAWFPTHWEAHWPSQPLFSLNPHVRVTLIGAFVYYIIASIAQCGSDQATIQRFLTTRDAPTARRAFLLTNWAIGGVCVLLALVGAALLAFYRANLGAIPNHMTVANNGDVFFPLYISQFFPTGISGLVVASLMALSMSCLSAGISAVITILTKDFVEIGDQGAGRTEKQRVAMSRKLALVIGLSVIVGGVLVGSVRGNIFEVAGKTVNLLTCPLFGLFFLAIFVKVATPFGAMMSALYSTAAALLVGYWDVFTGQESISFTWIAPIAMTISLVSGYGFSLLPTRGRSRGTIAVYYIVALAPMLAICAWLIAANRISQ